MASLRSRSVDMVNGPLLQNILLFSIPLLIGNFAQQLYSAVDLTLITSQRETFSMPVAESLCCGTPVVGFDTGGIPQQLSDSAVQKALARANESGTAAMLNEYFKQNKSGNFVNTGKIRRRKRKR